MQHSVASHVRARDDTAEAPWLTRLLRTPSQVLGEVIASVNIDSRFISHMQRKVTDPGSVVGNCERLIRTPLPVSYTRHTCRFLLLWLFLLPLALWQDLGWWTVLLSGFLSCMLLAIEEIGV